MNHAEKIKALEDQLQAEETKIKALFLTAKIPTPGDYAERDRIRAELKVARRVRAMDAKRVDPKLTRKISILLPEDEYQALTKKAAELGVDLSKYIRSLISGGK